MKILECLPRDLREHLVGHDGQTVPQAGLAGKANGELLALAERSGWQVLLTMDQRRTTILEIGQTDALPTR